MTTKTDDYAALPEWAKLREAAEKATPGPWHVEEQDPEEFVILAPEGKNGFVNYVAECHTINGEWDSAYIAAASPDVVLGLLDKLEFAGVDEALNDAGSALIQILKEENQELLARIAELEEMVEIGAECVYHEGQGLWQDNEHTAERFRELYEKR